LDNILQAIHNCRKCLDACYDSVLPPAIYDGSIDTPILIVGQAPGIEEHALIFQRYLCYPGKQPDGSGDRNPSSKQLDLCQPYLARVLSLMTGLTLKLILPVGRLAINAFFPASKPLEEIVGQQMKYSQALVIPLPHPSGLSRWHQKKEHRALIYQALGLIRDLNLTSTPLPR